MNKISLILPDLGGGGAEKVSIDLAKQFKGYGLEVEFVLCEKKGELLSSVYGEVPVHDLNCSGKLNTINAIRKYLNKSKPDYVIASMWGLTAYTAFAKALSTHSFKLLLVEHSSLINQFSSTRLSLRLWLKLSVFFSYRYANAVGGVSLGVAQDMQKLANLKQTPYVLYNPIPISEARNVESGKFKVKQVITAGRLIDAKDHETLIRAFAQLDQVVCKLTILGDGPLLEHLKCVAKNLAVIDNIVFAGFVDNPREYFNKSDLFVLSSKREGLPTVLIEAMGCGTPVVSTDCRHGPDEILNNGEFGELVPVGDATALAAAMQRSLTMKHNKKRLIERAKDFSPDTAARRYLEVLGVYADEK